MNIWNLFLVGILPLVVFVFLDYRSKNPSTAIIGGMVSACFFFFLLDWMYGFDDYFGYLELALILLLGGVSLYLNNKSMFKYQPVVTGVILGVVCLGMYFFGQPILVYYVPMMIKMNPEISGAINQPVMLRVLDLSSLLLGPCFLLHGGALAYAAKKWTSLQWLLLRLAIYPLCLAVMIMAALIVRSTSA